MPWLLGGNLLEYLGTKDPDVSNVPSVVFLNINNIKILHTYARANILIHGGYHSGIKCQVEKLVIFVQYVTNSQ